MNAAVHEAAHAPGRGVLLGLQDPALAQRIAIELGRIESRGHVTLGASLDQLREISARFQPAVILLEEALLSDRPFVDSVRQLTALATVVLVARPERQAEVAPLVAKGCVDFVLRAGDFVPIAVALIERRLRWVEISSSALVSSGFTLPEDLGEIFRHEINNPLTGILGNAELLLAHRDRFHSVDLQRLQTVVDLAVRLRETVRRVSNAWDGQPHSCKSVS